MDESLIAELEKDGRASYRTIAHSLGLSRSRVSTRVQELLTSGAIRIVAAANPRFLGEHVVAHVGIHSPGSVERLAEGLGAYSQAVLVSATTGESDLVIELRTADSDELYRLLSIIRGRRDVGTINTLVYIDILKGPFISDYDETVKTDGIDRRLITELQVDGRASYRDLAAAVGLSANAVRTRVQRLLDAGIITIRALTERETRSRQIMTGLGINVAGADDDIVAALTNAPDVKFVARTVGRFDVIATFESNSHLELFRRLESMKRMPSLRTVQTWTHVFVFKEDYARRLDHRP